MATKYTAVPMGVSSTYVFPSGSPIAIEGFLAVTSGTMTVSKRDGTVLINAFPVTGGQWYFMPFHVGHEGTVVLAGGASGTLATF